MSKVLPASAFLLEGHELASAGFVGGEDGIISSLLEAVKVVPERLAPYGMRLVELAGCDALLEVVTVVLVPELQI